MAVELLQETITTAEVPQEKSMAVEPLPGINTRALRKRRAVQEPHPVKS